MTKYFKKTKLQFKKYFPYNYYILYDKNDISVISVI